MIKILLADDHQMFLDGISAFLEKEPNIKIVGEALDGFQVLEFLQKNTVDIILLDIRMPGMDGHQTIIKIKQGIPTTKVLVVSTFGEAEYIYKMLSNGAEGYLMKNKSKEELVNAIHQIHSGQRYISLDVQQIYWDYIQNKSKKPKSNIQLTSREIEVLKLIATGLQDREIADQLDIAETTVYTHCRNLRKKIAVSNRTELAIHAKEHGII